MCRLTFAVAASRDFIGGVNEDPHHGSNRVRYQLFVLVDARQYELNNFDTYFCHFLALVLLVALERTLTIVYKSRIPLRRIVKLDRSLAINCKLKVFLRWIMVLVNH